MKIMTKVYMRLIDKTRQVIKYSKQIKYFVGWLLVLVLVLGIVISLSNSIKHKKYNTKVFEVNVKEDDFSDIFEQKLSEDETTKQLPEILKNKIQSHKTEQNQHIEPKK